MPNADSLITRDHNNSQLASSHQVWVVKSHTRTRYIGFESNFVKKHLFVDPDPFKDHDVLGDGTIEDSLEDRVTRLVDKGRRYANPLAGMGRPAGTDPDTLRFLKLKKLVRARSIQRRCTLCWRSRGDHPQICPQCGHRHFSTGQHSICNSNLVAPKCTCRFQGEMRYEAIADAPACPGYENAYESDRAAKGRDNTLAADVAPTTNTVILMSQVDLQRFQDAVVGGILREQDGWDQGQREIELRLGAPASVDTIETMDTYASYSQRAKHQTMVVAARRQTDVFYIRHFVSSR
jgi:hypothetical protein